ncbi:conserved hypothetical protein, partial [Ricinus communis]
MPSPRRSAARSASGRASACRTGWSDAAYPSPALEAKCFAAGLVRDCSCRCAPARRISLVTLGDQIRYVAERRNEARETGRAQRQERFARIPAMTLDDARCRMADAIDGKHSHCTLGNEPGQQRRRLLHAAIMKQQVHPCPRRKAPQPVEQAFAPADIKDDRPSQRHGLRGAVFCNAGERLLQAMVLVQQRGIILGSRSLAFRRRAQLRLRLRQTPLQRLGPLARSLELFQYRGLDSASRLRSLARLHRIDPDDDILKRVDPALKHAPLLGGRPQPLFLPGDLLVLDGHFILQGAQPRQIKTARTADQMREHMHLAEHVLQQRMI